MSLLLDIIVGLAMRYRASKPTRPSLRINVRPDIYAPFRETRK